MKKHMKFWIVAIVVAINLMMQPATAQVPDDTNGWLYRLCKTWGYVKYFNQHKCGLSWDNLLNETINEVLAAKNNAEFNSAMLNFLNQAGNNVAVANPPAWPETNLNFNDEWITDPVFSQPVRDFLDTFSKHIYPDQTDCLVKTTASSIIDFTNDRVTMFIDYSNEANRLTVMFYYWNIINYFSPYRNIMDQPWDTTLNECIPLIRKATNSTSFQKSFLKFITHINDTHATGGNIVYPNPIWGGTYVPGISFARVENQTVVNKLKNIQDISVGDILTHINGISIETISDSLSQYIPASTPAAFYRDMHKHMLRGPGNSFVELTLINRNGQTYTVSEKRSNSYGNPVDLVSPESYFITSCGYGYVNMGKLAPSEVTAMYNTLKNTPVIIFDIRNYPNGTMGDIAKFLFPGPITSAIGYQPALKWYSTWNYLPGWYYQYTDSRNFGTWTTTNPYSGKVILLVNQISQSHAEYTCQYLSYYPNSKVIGTQTAGADGNVTSVTLPGGLTTSFTALGWYYADGYQQQRNGVKIDSIVSPTIQGIREGKDEILLAALDCISGLEKSAVNAFDVTVFPNPVQTGSVKVALKLNQASEITVSLMDLTGKTLLRETRYCTAGDQTLAFDLNAIAPGLYFLETRNTMNSVITKLVIR